MKNISLLLKQMVLFTIFASLAIVSCKDNEEVGAPQITRVRVVEKDSSITGAEFGVTLAIQGNNLANVHKVLFNNLEAPINPVYVTNNNIICTVPDEAPTQVSNKITVITKSGQTATSDFRVVLPAPVVTGMYNQYAAPGTETTLMGDYFYLISKVMIGDREAAIVGEPTVNEITIKIPADAPANSPVTVVGEGGTVTTPFRYRESSGIIFNFDSDTLSKEWGGVVFTNETLHPEIPSVSGAYGLLKIDKAIGAPTWWNGETALQTKSTLTYPDLGDNTSADDLALQFEMNIRDVWNSGYLETNLGGFVINYTPWGTADDRTELTTEGWRTFTIPLSELKKDGKAVGKYSDVKGGSLFFVFKNPDQSGGGIELPSLHMAIDNIRIIKTAVQ
jgi:hypothetical protein